MKFYTYEEAFAASKEYFGGDDLAASVFIDKYALRDNEGNILEKTPEDMHWRLAKEFARIEKDKFKEPLGEEEIFKLFDKFSFICPQGSPMYGIGNSYQTVSLGNCFTLPKIYDSIGGITYTDQQLAQLYKRRAGVGVDISTIRPKGLPTNNSSRTTDGIVPFMDRFSNTTREIAIAGRRGALLISIDCRHPQIEDFINVKRDLNKVTGANISIKFTDEFMKCVVEDKDFTLQWPVDSEEPIVQRVVRAKSIWNEFIESNHASAEPGILWIDKIKKYGTSDAYKVINETFEDHTTNPCGEIPMGSDSCRLMLLNLYSYVTNPFGTDSCFDFELFSNHVRTAQRLMDDMVDLEIEKIEKIIDKVKSDPEPENIKSVELSMWEMFLENAKNGRRTGLGITALGDALAALNIGYSTDLGIEVSSKIYKTLGVESMRSSCLMAKEIGPFPYFDAEIENGNEFIENMLSCDDELRLLHDKYGRRNISLTTTAPAGSVSILTQTTSGIEPAFLLHYKRRKKINPGDKNTRVDFVDNVGDSWQEFDVYHKHFKTWMDTNNKTLEDLEESPYHNSTANDIDWSLSVDIQSEAQKWISHSISKTCNVPNDTPKELLSEIYLKAWEKGCKGFTVYRDGCRSGVLVSSDEKKDSEWQRTDAPKRPKTLPCDVFHPTKGGDRYYVVVGLYEDEPYEVFVGLNSDEEGDVIVPKSIKEGKLTKTARGKYILSQEDRDYKCRLTNKQKDDTVDAVARLTSTALRHGASINFVVHQLEKVEGDMMSFAKVLARTLKKYIKDGEKVSGQTCENCGSENIIRSEGCALCKDCGASRCG